MIRTIVICIFFFSVGISRSQTIIIQEEFTAGLPFGWTVIDADGFTPHSGLSQFTDGFINYYSWDDTSMASTSYFQDTVAAAEDYLITPKLSIPSFTKLSWEARSVDASYPDSYYVLISTTDSLPSSFTDTLMTVNNEYFIWNRKSIMLDTMGYANTNVFIAFRNFSSDGYILEIDDIWVEGSNNAGIEDNFFQFTFYPNPAQDVLNIEINEEFTARIFSTSGLLISEFTEKQSNISFLDQGTYFLQISTASGQAVKPFIKE
ncbi:MAG: choice-of-anchor J domain-containing protein [Crocinitomicaceae bacterium]